MYEVRALTLSDWQERIWERAVELAFKRGEAENRPVSEVVHELNELYEKSFAHKKSVGRLDPYPRSIALTASINGKS